MIVDRILCVKVSSDNKDKIWNYNLFILFIFYIQPRFSLKILVLVFILPPGVAARFAPSKLYGADFGRINLQASWFIRGRKFGSLSPLL